MSYKYYLKKLTSNELGYRNNKLVTGQIFYISKQAVSFFPKLSTNINNDSINLQLSVDYRDHPIYVNMVYHNDKYNRMDGTRDEFRIYLNRDVAPDDFFFRPNDIVIFEKISENYYSLKKIRDGDFGYEYFDECIKSSKSRGSHALLDDLEITFAQNEKQTLKTSIEKVHSSNLEVHKNNTIPLFEFYAAASTFSEKQTEKDYKLIECPSYIKIPEDYFAITVIGESMNRIISNGSICLFKKYTSGSRNGKIVLVENLDIQDQDFNSAFTVKIYTSEKIITQDGWNHTSIVLKPNSTDKSYKDIIINEENGSQMKVIGEFIEILPTPHLA